ncbi:hypothetical protein [Rheinheimera sp. 4Y26]|uniref:hypothetical protein n=1 Tax=Rheinheimera sp. 4Y26 TaxID=2977811 RepID=UPI0021B0E835|nr:hypothetical protein [Rheinheimera sp. 4Y26]MCT6699310.1 hypothetical protein [Rheinheimera sp. 4Y26]
MLIAIAGILFFLFVFFEDEIRLGWGYDIKYRGTGEWFVSRYDKVVVEPALFDYQILSGYLVAIGLPTQDIVCNHKPMRVYIDSPVYYVLKLDETILKSFLNKSDFDKTLGDLLLSKDVNLNYSLLDDLFRYGHRLDSSSDYSECLDGYNLSGKQVVTSK